MDYSTKILESRLEVIQGHRAYKWHTFWQKTKVPSRQIMCDFMLAVISNLN